jgi:hypothetical protein
MPPDRALALAKNRGSRRRRDAGAVMFIVAMTLAVLASIGVYALAAASNEVKTAGNERQSAQTHYMSQYGILTAAEELASAKAQLYLGLMLSAPDTNCISLQGVNTVGADPMVAACRRMTATEFYTASNWSMKPTVTYQSMTNTPFDPQVALPGSLGPVPVTADFFVELTAPTMASAATRYALNAQFCFIQFTATSMGETQPQYGASVYFGGESLEMQRARLVAGPVLCPR